MPDWLSGNKPLTKVEILFLLCVLLAWLAFRYVAGV